MNDLEGWRGASADIQLGHEDAEVMEVALSLVPEVRLCALALKWARAAKVHYPIMGVEDLVRAFPHQQFKGGGHFIDAQGIRTFLAKEYFPIENEGELLSRVYLALVRCRYEAAKAQSAKVTSTEVMGAPMGEAARR